MEVAAGVWYVNWIGCEVETLTQYTCHPPQSKNLYFTNRQGLPLAFCLGNNGLGYVAGANGTESRAQILICHVKSQFLLTLVSDACALSVPQEELDSASGGEPVEPENCLASVTM